MDFDEYFLKIAGVVAEKSKDTTKVGCVIVGEDNQILTTGWNGKSRGVQETPERSERPAKYSWVVHAEVNAVANAARSGTRLKGSTAYMTHMCCSSCIDVLIQAGITCVVVESEDDFHDPSIYNFDITETKAREAGVTIRKVLK